VSRSTQCCQTPAAYDPNVRLGWMRRVAVATAIIATAAAAIRAVRRASLRWGATPDELGMTLPGDDLLPAADLRATRAITIAAAPSAVWPWLAQLGQNRGGFYSYDWLENLVGVDIHTVDSIKPELQIRAVGDDVNLAAQVALSVVEFDEERALVLRGAVAPDGTGAGAPYDFTWAFVLQPRSDGSTRLVVREQYAYLTNWAALLVEPVEMVSFLMTERMLRGIRDRAEGSVTMPVAPA
jgi:hypothetical protein